MSDAIPTRAATPANDASSAAAKAAPPPPTRAEAFRYWLRLGCISFGGPAGQIAIMHRELVEERRWISERRFLHALNYCMVLPGPEAQQLATYIGWLLHRTWGGIVAGGLFVLPSLVLLIALSWLYMAHGDLPLVAGVLAGIKPAVVAIIVHAAWRIGSRALKHPLLWAIAAAAFVAIFAFSAPFPAIVLAAGLLGVVGGRLAPAAFAPGQGHAASAGAHGAAVIDDDTPPPPHAAFRPRRFAAMIAAFVALWAAALGVLVFWQGANGTLVLMGWFFTKAALLTIGGAYAVLPYVVQGGVETYGWLTPTQMIDGLALGETTPGPLIMFVTFVAFVGGWTQQVFGPDLLALAGAVAAVIVTFFTFLPSFLFILAGAPFIETTHGQLRFTAPLTGITAAVVGVIVNLGAFLGGHVLWPNGWKAGSLAGGLDLFAATLGIAAAVALFRYRVGIITVILTSGALGWIASLVR